MTHPAEQSTENAFPVLTEMGIRRIHEISHYTLQHEGRKHDVLKVHYKRAKGSLLPESRRYRFGRTPKNVVADGGARKLEDQYEISPVLDRALAELDRIVSRTEATKTTRARLLADIETLEKETTGRIREIRAQIEKL